MKLLVATALTQGERQNDYCFAVEGELVFILPPCAADRKDPDGPCGCGRRFAGLVSQHATTTARVTDVPDATARNYTEALRSGIKDQGYPTDGVTDLSNGLLELASYWPFGSVIERRLDQFARRALFHPINGADPNIAPSVHTIPDADLLVIRTRCAAKVRETDGSGFPIDVLARGRDVTLLEYRLWPSNRPGEEFTWTYRPAARLRYLGSSGEWQLLWTSGMNQWHSYATLPRSVQVAELLDEIDADPHMLLRASRPSSIPFIERRRPC
ncbi:DUF3024 domain-containing protein [Paenarthrobacter sp. PH39-S1]|uniref:DUF7715 family protein n=1 Tax=Paenarthrobacter sp. PH39-S1 TaxID=3046204 RepID=UPI0024B912C7|nr:DUF3024 domain-containing protein [Paenarthrobacter sp. PH39-S1]MDJ0356194.1 DUF3024 domain-containing protein [Paenarthrobacter sp. PH39-S1]